MCLCLDTVANKTFGGLKDEIQKRSGIRSWKFYLHDGTDREFGDFVVANIYTFIHANGELSRALYTVGLPARHGSRRSLINELPRRAPGHDVINNVPMERTPRGAPADGADN